MNGRVQLFIEGLMCCCAGLGICAEDAVPDYAHVAYSQNKPYNWLNVYLDEGTTKRISNGGVCLGSREQPDGRQL